MTTLSECPSRITLTAHDREDGTWFVEIMRPGIVCEHVGDFRSEASAQAWISENRDLYERQQALHDRAGLRRDRAGPLTR